MTPDANDNVKKPEKPLDVAFVGDKTDDGVGRKILRLKSDGASLGELRPITEGKALSKSAEIVKLVPREGAPPNVCDVETQFKMEAEGDDTSGPPKVSSNAYREGWDRIFSAGPNGEWN